MAKLGNLHISLVKADLALAHCIREPGPGLKHLSENRNGEEREKETLKGRVQVGELAKKVNCSSGSLQPGGQSPFVTTTNYRRQI